MNNNNEHIPYPYNTRYHINQSGDVIDSVTGSRMARQYTPTNKQYYRLITDDGVWHTVYLVYMLAVTFKGDRPSQNHHAVLINPRGCYVADNVTWQSENEARAKKIKIDKIKKILEGKTLDELDEIHYSLISPKKEYPPIPTLPDDVKAIVFGEDEEEEKSKKSLRDILASFAEEK